jgi:hypothetical protein
MCSSRCHTLLTPRVLPLGFLSSHPALLRRLWNKLDATHFALTSSIPLLHSRDGEPSHTIFHGLPSAESFQLHRATHMLLPLPLACTGLAVIASGTLMAGVPHLPPWIPNKRFLRSLPPEGRMEMLSMLHVRHALESSLGSRCGNIDRRSKHGEGGGAWR